MASVLLLQFIIMEYVVGGKIILIIVYIPIIEK